MSETREEQRERERNERVILEYNMPVFVEVDEKTREIHRVTAGYEDMTAEVLWNGHGFERLKDHSRLVKVEEICDESEWPSWD